MNSLFCNRKQNFHGKGSQTNAEYSPEHLESERGQLHVVIEDPCQNTFKDNPAFIKKLIKVLVASRYIAAAAATTDLSKKQKCVN